MKTLYCAVFLLGFGLGAKADQGKAAFEKRCVGCHSLDTNKVGPKIRGVFGRPAGKDPNFTYSTALKAGQFNWNEKTLDKWLANPEDLVPDTDMSFRLSDQAEREKIIEYLKQMKP